MPFEPVKFIVIALLYYAAGMVGLSPELVAQRRVSADTHAVSQPRMFSAPSGEIHYTRLQRCQLEVTPVPDSLVADVMRRCLMHFSSDRVAPTDLPLLLRLALIAHDDSLVEAVIARQLRNLHTTSDQENAGIYGNAISAAYEVVPRRLDLVERYLKIVNTRWPGATRVRFDILWGRLVEELQSCTDTTLVTGDQILAGLQLLQTIAQSSGSEPSNSESAGLMEQVAGLKNFFTPFATFLNEGPEAGIHQLAALSNGSVVGKQMLPVTGQFRFASDSSVTTESVHEHPSLIILAAPGWGINPAKDGETKDACLGTEGFVRMLQRRFPTLSVTVVEPVVGVSWQTGELMTLQEESDFERNWLFNELKIRGTLLIDTVAYATLPGHDRRRIPGLSETQVRLFAGNLLNRNDEWAYRLKMFLVDASGRIVLDPSDMFSWHRLATSVVNRVISKTH